MFSVIGGSSAPCALCREVHRDLARVLGTSAPDDWLAVSPGERLEAELTPDVCILPHGGVTRHFIRGHVQLPLLGPDQEIFVWSVWVEVEEESMSSIAASWSDPNRAAIAPIAGWLATELPYEQPTKGIEVVVHTRDPGQVPLLMLASGSRHALAAEQRDGVGLHRVAELAELLRR